MAKHRFLLLSLLTAFLWGQNYSLSGQITQENTPLSFVTIVISQEPEHPLEETSSMFTGQIVAATISDDDGRFSVDEIGRAHV